MLLLDLPLPGRFDGVEVRPVLEKDVRRDEGAEPPPVAPVLLVGDAVRSGDITGGLVVLPRSSAGISGGGLVNAPMLHCGDGDSPLSTVSVSALYRT